MNTTDSLFQRGLAKILTEIFDGPPGSEAYLLNPGDPGMLAQLETIDAAAASARPMPGKTTIASHVDHVWYGFTLMNRWAAGDEQAFAEADWSASWQRGVVNDNEWRDLCGRLRRETEAWRKTVATRSDWDEVAAVGVISSAAHTAYHLGAIRQILAAMEIA